MARDQIDMKPVQSRDELVAWLEAGNKPPSEFRIGTEHEKTPFTLEGHRPVPYEGARGIGGIDVTSLGIPTEDEYILKYCDRTGFTTPDKLKADWNFYLAYNMFRIAAILQGIAKRVEMGTASNEQAVKSGAGARPMALLAWKFAQQA